MHTQTVEAFNGVLKDRIREDGGVKLENMIPFINELNFRNRFLPKGELKEKNGRNEFCRFRPGKSGNFSKFLKVLGDVYGLV